MKITITTLWAILALNASAAVSNYKTIKPADVGLSADTIRAGKIPIDSGQLFTSGSITGSGAYAGSGISGGLVQIISTRSSVAKCVGTHVKDFGTTTAPMFFTGHSKSAYKSYPTSTINSSVFASTQVKFTATFTYPDGSVKKITQEATEFESGGQSVSGVNTDIPLFSIIPEGTSIKGTLDFISCGPGVIGYPPDGYIISFVYGTVGIGDNFLGIIATPPPVPALTGTIQ
jgi:hypothetical protein